MSLTVDRPFRTGSAESGGEAPEEAVGRVSGITRLMALAIKLDGYVRDGLVADYAELARLGHITRARITQVMDLLAPDIQEVILELPRTVRGARRGAGAAWAGDLCARGLGAAEGDVAEDA